MATYNATIERLNNISATLKLALETEELKIVLTDDNPNEVKSVFNRLLFHLKNGEIEFDLLDEGIDLYNNICREYIAQLNSELKSTYNELRDYGLLNNLQ